MVWLPGLCPRSHWGSLQCSANPDFQVLLLGKWRGQETVAYGSQRPCLKASIIVFISIVFFDKWSTKLSLYELEWSFYFFCFIKLICHLGVEFYAASHSSLIEKVGWQVLILYICNYRSASTTVVMATAGHHCQRAGGRGHVGRPVNHGAGRNHPAPSASPATRRHQIRQVINVVM